MILPLMDIYHHLISQAGWSRWNLSILGLDINDIQHSWEEQPVFYM